MHPLRSTLEDHLYSFRRHSGARIFHLNLQVHDRVPAHISRQRFDAIYFHTSFLSQRWAPEVFHDMVRRARPLRALSDTLVALPQDEFLRSKLVCDFINEFGVALVCSVAPESEWPVIYPTVDRSRVRFTRVLTGYLEEATLRRIDAIVARGNERDTDVGYRAWQGAAWLGRHGRLKGQIAEIFEAAALHAGLRADISTRDVDTLLGDDWFRFLARCRYTVGVEGGASVLDFEGQIKERTEAFLAEHPEAPFEEVEAACFPGEDGRLNLVALSPRHLEACATGTCQVLVEGDYNGVLRPGQHFIQLKRDLSNLDVVIDQMRDEDLRQRITTNARRDVVDSRAWTYRRFVDDVERATFGGRAAPVVRDIRADIALRVNRVLDWATWRTVWVRLRLWPRTVPLILRTPAPARRVAKRFLRRPR